MRFKANGPAIPDSLLVERDAGKVVFLCGAGVSKPAGMPDFIELAELVIKKLDPRSDSKIRRALDTHKSDDREQDLEELSRPSLDRIFQWLYEEYGRERVKKIVWNRLNGSSTSRRCESRPEGWEHSIIARLSANMEGKPQIVTTNFDRLFEKVLAASGKQTLFEPPMYPALRHGSAVTGITYLHGRLADRESGTHNYVLGSEDLGRAYLLEGWAARFVRDLLEHFTVVLLGYRAEDPPIRYMLQGLKLSGNRTRDRVFAFDQGEAEAVQAEWRSRQVKAIPYEGKGNDHDALWETLEAWAGRADDPASWRRGVVRLSLRGPRALTPHERGMVTHLVRTTVGAKEFAETTPSPPAEWLCVFDRSYRYGPPVLAIANVIEPFDPLESYRLDDDPPWVGDGGEGHATSRGDDLLAWRPGDESGGRWQRLAYDRRSRFHPLAPRLHHLAGWMVSCVNDPVLAWWIARQDALHPELYDVLQRAVGDAHGLAAQVRLGWVVLLRSLAREQETSLTPKLNRLKRQIEEQGWTPTLLLEFELLAEPVFKVDPRSTLAEPPPSGAWSDLDWKRVAHFSVRFPPKHISWPQVPESHVPLVYAALDRNLVRAAARLRTIDWQHVRPLSPFLAENGREANLPDDADVYVRWLRQLFARLARMDPARAKRHIALWPAADPSIFDKLRLWVWNNPELFSAAEVVAHIGALSDEQFWRFGDQRQLLFLLRDRWGDLSDKQRRAMSERILRGPPQCDDEDEARRQAALRFGWLARHDCVFPSGLVRQWTSMKDSLPRWTDDWISQAVAAHDRGVRDVEYDEDHSLLVGVPVQDIVSVARDNTGTSRASGVRKEPFTGLVKAHPARAIRALVAAARRGEFPGCFWDSALYHWPEGSPPRATRVLHGWLLRLPRATIDQMRNSVQRWLVKRFPEVASHDRAFGLKVWDHLVGSILRASSDGSRATGTAPAIRTHPVQASRPTFERAINSPVGQAVEGLWQVLERDEPRAGAGISEDVKIRFERLLGARGEVADDAVCWLSRRIAKLNRVDPQWVGEKMIPLFRLGHARFAAAWHGILWVQSATIRRLFDYIKPGFIALPTTMDSRGWHEEAWHYCEWIVDLTQSTGRLLSFQEARGCLRSIRADWREHVIWVLARRGADDTGGWREHVIPFTRHAWPNERRYRTSGTSEQWLTLLFDTGDAFPDVFDAVKHHLCEVDAHQFILDFGPRAPLAGRFPQQTLELLDRVVPEGMQVAPHGLSSVLDVLSEAAPGLVGDVRYSRLRRLSSQQ